MQPQDIGETNLREKIYYCWKHFISLGINKIRALSVYYGKFGKCINGLRQEYSYPRYPQTVVAQNKPASSPGVPTVYHDPAPFFTGVAAAIALELLAGCAIGAVYALWMVV